MLKVSVVVPVLNAMRTLPACLSALRRLDPAPETLVLVDNGSADNSLEYLHAFARQCGPGHVEIVEERRRGASVARNAGLGKATSDVIAFTDADCAPAPEWLRHLVEPFADPTVGAAAGRIVASRPLSSVELLSALYTLQFRQRRSRQLGWTPWEGGYPTANLAVRRALLVALGGFDESVGIYGEDYDLCARLYAGGAHILSVPEARVIHHHRTSLSGMLRQGFGFGRSHPYLLRRHAASGVWLELPTLSLAWPRCPVRAWVNLASADKKLLMVVAAGAIYAPLLSMLPLYCAWLTASVTRRARRDGRQISPRAAVEVAGLLVAKSAAMTAGRWWGSMRYGAVCF
jgi:glycosyltransferase involved in cell wall biosynthesis